MSKKLFKNIIKIICFSTIGFYSSSSFSAQDPTRPPSWMTKSTAVKMSTEALTLQQILISKNRKVAVINEKPVSEGDMIEGAKVKEIDRDWVKVMRSGRYVKLQLLPITKELVNE